MHNQPPKQIPFQTAGSRCPTVPDNERLVILEEITGLFHIGWFSATSGWWFALDSENPKGERLPKGQFTSVSIGNIIQWYEIGLPSGPLAQLNLVLREIKLTEERASTQSGTDQHQSNNRLKNLRAKRIKLLDQLQSQD